MPASKHIDFSACQTSLQTNRQTDLLFEAALILQDMVLVLGVSLDPNRVLFLYVDLGLEALNAVGHASSRHSV